MEVYLISKTKLLYDLYYAFECARKHKSSKPYIQKFEENLHKNLVELRDEIYERRYTPSPSFCFIIKEPKKREVFAAHFRDRVVHHLYYNYVYELFDKTFIEDSYSCRKGKGTHYGIHRLEQHIRQESENYTKGTYVLKMDIKGYFIHINRTLLLQLVNNTLDKMMYRKGACGVKYCDYIDFGMIRYLSEVIIMLNPIENCILVSDKSEWVGLSVSKSLFFTDDDCGLPIGNLTSQLFSNVYLNVLDQYMKRVLRCRHYGRYVDDFYVVSKDCEFLSFVEREVEKFMMNELTLEIQKKKTRIINIRLGVEFLGAFILPYRTYLSNNTLKRIKRNLYAFQHRFITYSDVGSMVNSYIGMFSHYHSNNVKRLMFESTPKISKYGVFLGYYCKYVSY